MKSSRMATTKRRTDGKNSPNEEEDKKIPVKLFDVHHQSGARNDSTSEKNADLNILKLIKCD